MSESPHCECGEVQTVRHIVCPRTNFIGGVEKLRKAEPEAILRLEILESRLQTYLNVVVLYRIKISYPVPVLVIINYLSIYVFCLCSLFIYLARYLFFFVLLYL